MSIGLIDKQPCFPYYRPQQQLRKGYVFTPVCQSFCSQKVYTPRQTPLLGRPPSPREGHCTGDGTHVTGMHSCFILDSFI